MAAGIEWAWQVKGHWVVSWAVNAGHFCSTCVHDNSPFTRLSTTPGSSSSWGREGGREGEIAYSIYTHTHAYRGPDLPHGVPLSESGTVGLDSVKVHCHSERNPNLISSGVSLANGPTTVVYLVRYAS